MLPIPFSRSASQALICIVEHGTLCLYGLYSACSQSGSQVLICNMLTPIHLHSVQFTCYCNVHECTWLCSRPLCQHCYLKSTTCCVVCQLQLELYVQLSSTWMCSLPLCQLHWTSSPYKRDQGSAPALKLRLEKEQDSVENISYQDWSGITCQPGIGLFVQIQN